MGKALKFPPQILGDVFADPNAVKDRSDAVKRAEAKRRKADVAASTKAAFHDRVNAMSSEARDAFFVERRARIEEKEGKR